MEENIINSIFDPMPNSDRDNSKMLGIMSIQAFKLEPDQIKQLYPRAYALPQFFLTNLVSPQRVVKCFTGKTALIEAFYYQLMKLALEVETDQVDYCKKVMEMFVSYEYFEEGELKDQLFSDFQYRKFFKDFLELVDKENIPCFQQKAQEYPIIDEILRKYFRLLVPFPLIQAMQDPSIDTRHSARELLTFLCQLFSISLSELGPCFKFAQSDTFVYFEQPEQVYLAFNDEFMEGEGENSSEFRSTFKCGQGNSFLTKYHSQSNSNSKTGKSFEKSKHWKQISEEEPVIEQAQEPEHHPLWNLRHISCRSQQQNFLSLSNSKLKEQAVSKGFTNIFSAASQHQNRPPLPHSHLRSHPQKQNDKSLYNQFTSTFIVRQLSPQNQATINSIKQRYRARQSIRGVI